jgi:hypothetical protein
VIVNALDAKKQLELEGLYVSHHNPHSLWIAATVRDMGEGIKLSEDACSLICKSGQWIAVFPAEGLCTYEVPGLLPDLVTVVSRVYEQHRRTGGPFQAAFRQVVNNPDQYVVGRSLARV